MRMGTPQTVGDLREMLEEFEDDTPLRAAVQPNYPLGARVMAANLVDDIVWIAVSDGEDYEATGEMWDA